MKLTKLITALLTIGITAPFAVSADATNLEEALLGGKVSGNIRLRAEHADNHGGGAGANKHLMHLLCAQDLAMVPPH